MIKRIELTDKNSCLNNANDNEMIFVLLARDPAAPIAIEAWIQERIRLGKNNPDDLQIINASECAYVMEQQRAMEGFKK